MESVVLTTHARTTAARSKVTIVASAKWSKVEIQGWRYTIKQDVPGVVLLTPADPSNPWTVPGFDVPPVAVGGMDLEICLDEEARISGNADRLVVSSATDGVAKQIVVHCEPSSLPALAACFEVTGLAESDGPSPIDLKIHARGSAERSTVRIADAAKWYKVEMKAWVFDLAQTSPRVISLTHNGSAPRKSSHFDLPRTLVGRVDLEIQVNESVWISGSADRLVVHSPNEGEFKAAVVHCVPSTQAALAESFTLLART